MVFISVLILWIISLCLHEYAHARVAYAGGDSSVVAKGYLTMNPLRYMHPFMSIILPLIILALGGVPLPGGAVYIDTSRIRSRAWLSGVAVAGPAANFALLLLCALPFALGLYHPLEETGTLWPTIALFGYFQGASLLLNMLPIPGLDGYGVIEPWLPPALRNILDHARMAGFILLLAVLMTDNPVSDTLLRWISTLPTAVGIDKRALSDGVLAFQSFRETL
ncbi:MAG: site-2 protease family protein [Planctomycetes bacterium]|nr:site-2 protease family protein [Planctomycetota bacterium]